MMSEYDDDAYWSEDDDEARLREALKDALEGLEVMKPYADATVGEKWDHADYVYRARKALGLVR